MVTDKKLFLSLFVFQVFSAFLVVSGHYTADVDASLATNWDLDLNQISRYGTVLLAMITGFFTAHSFQVKKVTGIKFFSGKIKYIFIPFLVAGVLYNRILLGHFPHSGNEFLNILLGKTGDHLYFVFMLLQYYIFAYLLRNVITKKNIVSFLVVFLGIQYTFIKVDHSFFGLGIRHFLPTWIFTIYLGHTLYLYRGAILDLMEKKKWVWFLLCLIGGGSALYFVRDPKLYTANQVSFVISTFVILLARILLINQFAERLPIRFRKGLTFYIYLFHSALIIFFNQVFIEKLDFDWLFSNKWCSFFYLATIFLVTLFISIGITRLLKGVKIIQNVVRTKAAS